MTPGTYGSNRLVVDIETIPQQAALTTPYPEAERQPPANYKSEEAIAKWRAADALAWSTNRIKECSLNPRLGRIICIGTSVGMFEAYAFDLEARSLVEFWEAARAHQYCFATFNGEFDLRFLVVRSLALGVMPTDFALHGGHQVFSRYNTKQHFDCLRALSGGQPNKGDTLAGWAEAMGLGAKQDGMTGADVYTYFDALRWNEISAYCKQDVALTLELYNTIGPALDPFYPLEVGA